MAFHCVKLFSAMILSVQSWCRDADHILSNFLSSQVLMKQDELQLSTLSYLILLLISPTVDNELLDEAKHRLLWPLNCRRKKLKCSPHNKRSVSLHSYGGHQHNVLCLLTLKSQLLVLLTPQRNIDLILIRLAKSAVTLSWSLSYFSCYLIAGIFHPCHQW